MKNLNPILRLSLVIGCLTLFNAPSADAQLFSNWPVPDFVSAWLTSLQNASSQQSCPVLGPDQTLSLGKVAEVGTQFVGTTRVYVARAPYGRVGGELLQRAIRLRFLYEAPCTNCSELQSNTSERSVSYARVVEQSFALGKALFVKINQGSTASWALQNENEECVYTIQGAGGENTFGLMDEVRVE